jgi:hypothetical protein
MRGRGEPPNRRQLVCRLPLRSVGGIAAVSGYRTAVGDRVARILNGMLFTSVSDWLSTARKRLSSRVLRMLLTSLGAALRRWPTRTPKPGSGSPGVNRDDDYGFDVDLRDVGELTPAVAVLARKLRGNTGPWSQRVGGTVAKVAVPRI